MKNIVDIRDHGDDFLSHVTFNVRELWEKRHEKNFEELLKTKYIFSNTQMIWLKDDLMDDLEDLEDYFD